MSIINLKETRNHIINWLRDYAEKAGTKTFVVGLSGGIDSALIALLCKKTNIPTICVILPCHSSEFSSNRAETFAIEFGLKVQDVDLTAVNDLIIGQIKSDSFLTEEGMNNPIALGGLRSCLRAPVLSYFALATRGLIVGTGNRSEDRLIRYYQKFGDGCVDLCPISDLFKSEVYELFAHMTILSPGWISEETGEIMTIGPPTAAAIYEATPTADLWGAEGGQTDEEELGVSYDEVEWADRENMRNGIITSNNDPNRHRSWVGYTLRQKEVIAKVHQMEKVSRHKYNPNLPICGIRNITGLVK